jgi:8-oxo-dGTP diphosphatase
MADRHLIDVHVLLVRDDQLLLTRRRDVDPAFDGLWHPFPPASSRQENPSSTPRPARSKKRSVSWSSPPIRHGHTLHVNGSGSEPRLGLFFETRHWLGEPGNREPDKCSAVRWFDLDALPDELIPYPASGINAYRTGLPFSARLDCAARRQHHGDKDLSVFDVDA